MSYSNAPVGDRPLKQSPVAPSDMMSSPAPAQPMFSNGKAGVGLFFQEEKKELIVRNIVPGGSAAANGAIKPGDIIISVDGRSVEGQGIETLRDCIIGKIGTFVELSFLRPSATRSSVEGPVIFSVTLERKSQTKTVNSSQGDGSFPDAKALVPRQLEPSPASAAPLSISSSADESSLELQKLHRRVSDLTYEKADLQSLLDQKNVQADVRQKTIDMLETQLQSSIAENERLTREADFAKMRESQAQSAAVSSSSKEASLASANVELQAAVARLRDSASAADASALAEQRARAAIENELAVLRAATQVDAGREDELRAAKDANARLTEDNAAIKGWRAS
jgi:hypothetical protein